MGAAMQVWGPDGGGLWLDGCAGMGHALRCNTPESRAEKLPDLDPLDNLVLVSTGRLDNRPDLLSVLGIGESPHQIPDSRLILAAYRKWGFLDSLNHLVGDWTFAIWEPERRRLLLARDQTGNSGLCYYQDGKRFAFASSLHGLLALDQIPKAPDELRLAQVLVSWPGDGTRTAFQGIRRLPPGHCLILDCQQATVRTYWEPQALPSLEYRTPELILEAFMGHYQQAVCSALRSFSPVGATLSGGLDSGSVCVLAADQLTRRGQRLQTFSSVPRFDTQSLTPRSRFGDERSYIEATANFNGKMVAHFVDAAGITPLDGIRRSLETHLEPGHAAGNQYWIIDLLEKAHQQGIQTLLTGQGGNGTISYTGPRLTALERWLTGGAWRDFIKELRDWRSAHNRTWWGVLRSQVLRPLVPNPLMQRYWRWQAGDHPWQDYAAINSRFASELGLLQQMKTSGYDPSFHQDRSDQVNFFHPGHLASCSLWMENGAAYQMEICDPTLDRRLVEFCLAIPRRFYAQDGHSRLLVRRALEGRLPPEVLWNERRGLQAADISPRLLEARSQEQVQEVLAHFQRSPLIQRVLDVPRLQSIFERAQGHLDQEVNQQVSMILLRGMGVGLFLLGFEGKAI